MSHETPKYEYDPSVAQELLRLMAAGQIPMPNLRRLRRLIDRFNKDPSAENAMRLLNVTAIMAGRPRTGNSSQGTGA